LNSDVAVSAANVLHKAVGNTVHLDCHKTSFLHVALVVAGLHVEVNALNTKVLACWLPGMQFLVSKGALQVPAECTLQSDPVAIDGSNTAVMPVIRKAEKNNILVTKIQYMSGFSI
jgi:hypothetical protein